MRAGILANERGVSQINMEMIYSANATLLSLLAQYKMLGDVSLIIVTLHLVLSTQIY